MKNNRETLKKRRTDTKNRIEKGEETRKGKGKGKWKGKGKGKSKGKSNG